MNNEMKKTEAKCLVEKKDKVLSIELHLPGYQKGEVKVKAGHDGLSDSTEPVEGLRGELECRGFENYIPFNKKDGKEKYFETEKIKATMVGEYLTIIVPIAEKFHPTDITIG